MIVEAINRYASQGITSVYVQLMRSMIELANTTSIRLDDYHRIRKVLQLHSAKLLRLRTSAGSQSLSGGAYGFDIPHHD